MVTHLKYPIQVINEHSKYVWVKKITRIIFLILYLSTDKALFFIRKMLITFLFLDETICCGYSLEALMSTHNICIRREIRKILCGYPLLSVAMLILYQTDNPEQGVSSDNVSQYVAPDHSLRSLPISHRFTDTSKHSHCSNFRTSMARRQPLKR